MNRGENKKALKYLSKYLDLYMNSMPAERRKNIEQWIRQLEEK